MRAKDVHQSVPLFQHRSLTTWIAAFRLKIITSYGYSNLSKYLNLIPSAKVPF